MGRLGHRRDRADRIPGLHSDHGCTRHQPARARDRGDRAAPARQSARGPRTSQRTRPATARARARGSACDRRRSRVHRPLRRRKRRAGPRTTRKLPTRVGQAGQGRGTRTPRHLRSLQPPHRRALLSGERALRFPGGAGDPGPARRLLPGFGAGLPAAQQPRRGQELDACRSRREVQGTARGQGTGSGRGRPGHRRCTRGGQADR